MIYLISFRLSNRQIANPNIYPYNVFREKDIEPFVFDKITVLYGNNGSGKSTLLNIIANTLQIKGREQATSNSFGSVRYCEEFASECGWCLGDDDDGYEISEIPGDSRYIKSEDILYEIKKIQQSEVLSKGLEYDYVKRGMTPEAAREFINSKQGIRARKNIEFAQYLQCQFIIATHSPFMLGTLNAKIYNLDTKDYEVTKWSELENVRYFYDFFKKYEREFL